DGHFSSLVSLRRGACGGRVCEEVRRREMGGARAVLAHDGQGHRFGYGRASPVLQDHRVSRSRFGFDGCGVGLPKGVSRQGAGTMTKRWVYVLATLVLASAGAATADEAMTSWKWSADVTAPSGARGLCSVTLIGDVLESARQDLADLRLVDGGGREIPFAVRIRRNVDQTSRVEAKVFNKATAPGLVSELTVDLGEDPGPHNEAVIETAGENFRRQVEIEGSDD